MKEINLTEKVQVRALTMLARINFIAWLTFVMGILVVCALVVMYFIFPDFYAYDPKFPNVQQQWLMIGFGGLVVAIIGFWMVRQVQTLREKIHDVLIVDRKLMLLTVVTLTVGLIIAVPFLLVNALLGYGLLFIFVALSLDVARFRSLVWRTKNNPQEIVDVSKSSLKQIWKLIYPRVRHDKMWHRAVTIVGWVVSFFSYFVLFPVYFGIIQRMIYFIAYGDKREEWLVGENKTN